MPKEDQILGELKEFKRATLKRLDEIEKEVKGLAQFKWRVAGGFGVLFLIVEFFKH